MSSKLKQASWIEFEDSSGVCVISEVRRKVKATEERERGKSKERRGK
jgi:hypothetical protein